MLWFYGRASCCRCRWWFWPFNPHQHYFTVLTPPPGKNVCKSHKKIKCFMIWAHLFLQRFISELFLGWCFWKWRHPNLFLNFEIKRWMEEMQHFCWRLIHSMLNNDLPFSTGIFKMDKVDKRSKSKQDIHHLKVCTKNSHYIRFNPHFVLHQSHNSFSFTKFPRSFN